nr:HemA [Chlorobaculum tepidum]
MNIISVGVNHKTAPIEIRERIALSEVQNKELVTDLVSSGLASEAMVVSTCNRTELYVVPGMPEVNCDYLKDYIISYKNARNAVRPEHFFSRFYCGTARHLFEVSCAIDSLVLGEGQILGQVKNAYRIAAEVGTAGILLTRLCHTAFSVAKKVKTRTKLMEGAVSVSYAAVELAQKIFSNLSMKKVLLIGAGETGELAAKHMYAKNARNIVITNRTQSKAEALAEELGTNRVLPYESYKEHLHEFDIIITAVSTKEYILNAAEMQQSMAKRRLKPVIILDLGLPRNVDPEVGALQNMFLKDIDALKHIIDKNLERRRAERQSDAALRIGDAVEHRQALDRADDELRSAAESSVHILVAERPRHVGELADQPLIDVVSRFDDAPNGFIAGNEGKDKRRRRDQAVEGHFLCAGTDGRPPGFDQHIGR